MQEGIYDQFLNKFTATAVDLTKKTSDPFKEGIDHGPQVSKLQFEVRPQCLSNTLLPRFHLSFFSQRVMWDRLILANQQALLSTTVLKVMETKDSSSNLLYSLTFSLI